MSKSGNPEGEEVPPSKTGVVVTGALGLIGVYQKLLSPVFYFFGARCRHAPTCSEYAATAFRRHGAWAGFWLTVSRLARCHPLGSHGWDPVPESRPKAGWQFWLLGDWAWTKREAGEPEAEPRACYRSDQ